MHIWLDAAGTCPFILISPLGPRGGFIVFQVWGRPGLDRLSWARPGSARLGSPGSAKVGVLRRRDATSNNNVLFRVDETTMSKN